LEKTWVNVHDVLEAVRTGKDPPAFTSRKELLRYSKMAGKGFSPQLKVTNPLFAFIVKHPLWRDDVMNLEKS
jgi:hypothetical protein